MAIRKRKFIKFLIKQLSLTNFVNRLLDINLEILHDETSENILSSRAIALSNLLSSPILKNPPKLCRYGSLHDGGYTLVEVQQGEFSLLSFGVGDDITFEADLSKLVNEIHLYDFSVTQLPVDIDNATFFQLGIAAKKELNFVTLKDAVNALKSETSLILKMDIEGYEWEVLNSTAVADLDRFEQIVIEFHGVTDLRFLTTFEIMYECFRKLNVNHAPIVVHANNFGSYRILGNVPVPEVIEVTYLHRKRLNQFEPQSMETAVLDTFANNPSRPEICLAFYSGLNGSHKP
jgi:hypothetical protein